VVWIRQGWFPDSIFCHRISPVCRDIVKGIGNLILADKWYMEAEKPIEPSPLIGRVTRGNPLGIRICIGWVYVHVHNQEIRSCRIR